MSETPRSPTGPGLDALLEAPVAKRLGEMRTCLPGIVVSYDHATQRATVLVTIDSKKVVDGELISYQPPPIPNVPVHFPSGTNYAITWPLSAGDPVTLVFEDRSTTEWRASGASRTTPRDPRRWDWSDAVALPGGRTQAAGPTGPIGAAGRDAAAMVLQAPLIKLGDSTATDFVALASLVVAQLNALWTAHNGLVAALNALVTVYNGHSHLDPVSGSTGTPSAPGVPAIPGGPAGNVAATKVKAV